MSQSSTRYYPWWFDFDGTMAKTFELSPSGIGVERAYEQAIGTIFGDEGMSVYRECGGLRNRAPTEVVKGLLDVDCSLVGVGRRFWERNKYSSRIVWDRESPWHALGEILVQEKLDLLVAQVGSRFDGSGDRWPRPFQGLSRFFFSIRQANRRSGARIEVGIISSGHTEFIRSVFRMWGMPFPRIVVTDDDIRWRQYPPEISRRAKPGFFPLALAKGRWLAKHRESDEVFVSPRGLEPNMVYVGDDANKDGGFARENGIAFCHFQPIPSLDGVPASFSFSSWQELSDWLVSTRTVAGLKEGKPMAELLMQMNQRAGVA